MPSLMVCCLSTPVFSGPRVPFPCHFDGRGPPNHEEEASGESLRGFFYERMS